MLGYMASHVGHGSVRNFQGVLIANFSQDVVLRETFFNYLKKILSNVGFDIKGEWGIEPCHLSSSFLSVLILSVLILLDILIKFYITIMTTFTQCIFIWLNRRIENLIILRLSCDSICHIFRNIFQN